LKKSKTSSRTFKKQDFLNKLLRLSNEKIIKTLEKEKTNAMEMAEKASQKGKEKETLA